MEGVVKAVLQSGSRWARVP
ncbi:hypothetical protein LINPERHAP2_LOCUS9629 [Linum perenne]